VLCVEEEVVSVGVCGMGINCVIRCVVCGCIIGLSKVCVHVVVSPVEAMNRWRG